MYDINLMERAECDLREAVEYISQILGNEIAATNLLVKVTTAIKSLSENPMRQPLANDGFLAQKGIRILRINNYNLFYVVRERSKSVTITRFIHSRRDQARLFDINTKYKDD